MRYLIISLVVILFVGCTTTTPPKSEFRINPNILSKKLNISGCSDKSLKVAQAFSSNTLMSQSMNYGIGDTKQYAYSKSQWSLTPNRAITDEFLVLLREMKIFKSVQISKSRSKNDFILEINIEDFMQYFNADSSNSYVNVLISLTLIDSKTNYVFATKTFSAKIDTLSLDANGGVIGLNKALANVLSQSGDWFGEVCR